MHVLPRGPGMYIHNLSKAEKRQVFPHRTLHCFGKWHDVFWFFQCDIYQLVQCAPRSKAHAVLTALRINTLARTPLHLRCALQFHHIGTLVMNLSRPILLSPRQFAPSATPLPFNAATARSACFGVLATQVAAISFLKPNPKQTSQITVNWIKTANWINTKFPRTLRRGWVRYYCTVGTFKILIDKVAKRISASLLQQKCFIAHCKDPSLHHHTLLFQPSQNKDIVLKCLLSLCSRASGCASVLRPQFFTKFKSRIHKPRVVHFWRTPRQAKMKQRQWLSRTQEWHTTRNKVNNVHIWIVSFGVTLTEKLTPTAYQTHWME